MLIVERSHVIFRADSRVAFGMISNRHPTVDTPNTSKYHFSQQLSITNTFDHDHCRGMGSRRIPRFPAAGAPVKVQDNLRMSPRTR